MTTWDADERYSFIDHVRIEAVRLSMSFRDALSEINHDPWKSMRKFRVMVSHSDGSSSTGYALPSGKTTADVVKLTGWLMRQYDRIQRQLPLAGVTDVQVTQIIDELLAITDQPVREFSNDFSALGYQR